MIIVTASLYLDPIDATEFVDGLRATATATRAEEGCLFYTAALEDAATGRVLMVEKWRDQAALTAHLSTPETQAFLGKWAGKMKGDVLKYDASNERGLMD